MVVLQGVVLLGVDLQGVGLRAEECPLNLRRDTQAVLCGGIRGGKDAYLLEGWVGEVGVMLPWLRVLGSLCLLVVSPLTCVAAVLVVLVYYCGLLRLRLPRRT